MKRGPDFHDAYFLYEKHISCVPLAEHSKTPPRGFPLSEYFEQMPTLGEIRKWFGIERTVRFNLAAICGSISGIVVVDTDSRQKAEEWYRKMPRTDAMSQTANGVHFYYQLQPGTEVRPRVKIAGMDLDIRGEQSYVVAPPSIHPTGQQYRWVNLDWQLVDVPYFDESWIEAEIDRRTIRVRHAVSNATDDKKVSDLMAYCLRIPSIQGQNGSKGCFRVACLCRDQGLSTEQALDFMLDWQERNPAVEPKWSERELIHKIESAYSKGGQRV